MGPSGVENHKIHRWTQLFLLKTQSLKRFREKLYFSSLHQIFDNTDELTENTLENILLDMGGSVNFITKEYSFTSFDMNTMSLCVSETECS